MLPSIALSVAGTESTDWFGVGLVLAIAGSFLLANALVFQHPRRMVDLHFGRSGGRLRTIRETIFQRLQVHLGFLLLLVGFGLQLFGHYQPAPTAAFPVGWVGIILLGVIGLEVSGWWLSHWLFRRYVRDYFLENPPDFETDVNLARELGELYGIPSAGDDTVQAYLARLRHRIGLPERASGPRREEGLGVPFPEASEELV